MRTGRPATGIRFTKTDKARQSDVRAPHKGQPTLLMAVVGCPHEPETAPGCRQSDGTLS